MFCVFIKVYYRKRFSGSTSGCSDSWSFQSIIVPHGLLLSLLLLFLCPPCDPPSVAARSQACNMIRPGQTSHWGAAGGSYTENIAEQSEVELQQKGEKKKWCVITAVEMVSVFQSRQLTDSWGCQQRLFHSGLIGRSVVWSLKWKWWELIEMTSSNVFSLMS